MLVQKVYSYILANGDNIYLYLKIYLFSFHWRAILKGFKIGCAAITAPERKSGQISGEKFYIFNSLLDATEIVYVRKMLYSIL
jgi:hypothetical protein